MDGRNGDAARMLETILNRMLTGELDKGLASCAGYLGQGIIKALEEATWAGVTEEEWVALRKAALSEQKRRARLRYRG